MPTCRYSLLATGPDCFRIALGSDATYCIDRGYGYKFALEAKPNEPRADIYMSTTGHYLGLIPTLDHPEIMGVNPEVGHETENATAFRQWRSWLRGADLNRRPLGYAI